MPYTYRASRTIALLSLCFAVGCRSAGTGLGSAGEQQRRVAQALDRAKRDLDAGVTELARRSAALDADGVATLLPEIARRDTLYRKLVSLRRIHEDGVNPALADSIDMRSTPPRLDIPATPLIESFADGRHWMLQGYLLHRFGNTPHVLVVPPGFVTDLTSVPDVAKPLLPRAGEYSNAAILQVVIRQAQTGARYRPSCRRQTRDPVQSPR